MGFLCREQVLQFDRLVQLIPGGHLRRREVPPPANRPSFQPPRLPRATPPPPATHTHGLGRTGLTSRPLVAPAADAAVLSESTGNLSPPPPPPPPPQVLELLPAAAVMVQVSLGFAPPAARPRLPAPALPPPPPPSPLCAGAGAPLCLPRTAAAYPRFLPAPLAKPTPPRHPAAAAMARPVAAQPLPCVAEA